MAWVTLVSRGTLGAAACWTFISSAQPPAKTRNAAASSNFRERADIVFLIAASFGSTTRSRARKKGACSPVKLGRYHRPGSRSGQPDGHDPPARADDLDSRPGSPD